MKRAVTQSQIAKKAGVSQAAVSAILSGSGSLNVSEETRTNVLAIAEKLGYVARKSPRIGQAGSNRRSVLIVESAPVARETNEEWISSAYEGFMGKIFSHSCRYLQEHGIGLSGFQLTDPLLLTQWLADSDVEGVFWHATDMDTALLHWIASRFPLVLLNREWKSGIKFDSVSISQESNILTPAEHLYSLGHRRIATFGHHPTISFYRRRIQAYQQFVAERGLRNYSEFQEISDAPEVPALDKVHAIIDTWKRLGDEAPTAFITGDVFALPLIREARLAGIRVPDDLSLIGIDNTAPCAFVDPMLSSMEGSFEEMCRIAVQLLLRRKANPEEPAISVQLAPNLISRQSVRSLTGSSLAFSSQK